MAAGKSNLTKSDNEDLVFDLVYSIVQAKNINDSILFLQDLLTKSEMQMLSKRLRIAKLLLKGKTYRQIQSDIKVSHGTVAKIAEWLAEKGDGFRKIIKNLPEKKKEKSWVDRSDWDGVKRRHGLYFWPELLLEEIVKQADNKQKKKISEALDKLDEKSQLHRRIEKLLKYSAT